MHVYSCRRRSCGCCCCCGKWRFGEYNLNGSWTLTKIQKRHKGRRKREGKIGNRTKNDLVCVCVWCAPTLLHQLFLLCFCRAVLCTTLFCFPTFVCVSVGSFLEAGGRGNGQNGLNLLGLIVIWSHFRQFSDILSDLISGATTRQTRSFVN